MNVLIKKLKGITLLEQLISLAILSVVMVCGFMIYGGLQGIHSPQQNQLTRALVRESLYQPVHEISKMKEEQEKKGRMITRVVHEKGALLIIHVQAHFGEKLLLERYRVIAKGTVE